MSKVAIVYWSGTGNTAAMADAVEEGAKGAGAEAVKVGPSDFKPEDVDLYDAIAFGCPSMGDEVLEEARDAGIQVFLFQHFTLPFAKESDHLPASLSGNTDYGLLTRSALHTQKGRQIGHGQIDIPQSIERAKQ